MACFEILIKRNFSKRNDNLEEAISVYAFDDSELKKLSSQAQQLIADSNFEFLFSPQHYVNAYKEVAITYRSDNGQINQGIIDRLVETEKELWIVDFKTQAVEQNEEQQAQSFSKQLAYYEIGVRKMWPQKKIRKAILFTETHELVELT